MSSNLDITAVIFASMAEKNLNGRPKNALYGKGFLEGVSDLTVGSGLPFGYVSAERGELRIPLPSWLGYPPLGRAYSGTHTVFTPLPPSNISECTYIVIASMLPHLGVMASERGTDPTCPLL